LFKIENEISSSKEFLAGVLFKNDIIVVIAIVIWKIVFTS